MKWFFGAAVLLLTALLLESGLLAYAMYVLLAVLIISRALARSWIEGISASRKCAQQTAEIGESVQVDITVRNAGWLPVPWVLLEDLLPQAALEQKPPRLRIKGKRLQIRMLPAGKEVKADYEIQCDMRGYYQIGPMVMESGDLFGLHRRYRIDAEPQYLLVYPKVVPLQGYDLASRRPIGDVRMIHRLFEDPTRISGVRPYEAGDPLNRVHWRATARTGMLHSKIYEPSTLAGATLLLDFHKAGYHRQGEPHRSELAVTTAASLANAVYELGQQIGLLSNGRDAVDRIRQEGWQHDHRTRLAAREKVEMRDSSARLEPLVVQTRRGMEQFQRIRETLARVELTDGLTTAELIIEVASRIPRDATVVAVLPDVSVETALALGTLRRQGFAVSAVLITLGPEQLEKSYGRLLAEGIMDVRHLVSEEGLPELCRQQVRKATPYLLETDLT
ncbi:MAG TPA: DUF58 domain-containing protein [Gemmataceae bacterium]|jgi:uncharacterized repeat protein (TIGR01451 family)|nr:DUF58 domain-containing protein [Gemmataceae bacterium]